VRFNTQLHKADGKGNNMTKKQNRQQLEVAHMTFETLVDPRGGTTFALFVGDMINKPKPLFTGHIEKGMAAQLLELSAHVRQLEREL